MKKFPLHALPAVLLLVSGCTTSAPKTALPVVQDQVATRTGLAVSWPLDEDERAKSEAAVRDLLAADLTVDSAVQIALLNNRSLRATFEELGLAQAGLAAAARLPNPRFDASLRWPNTAPRGPNAEFGLSLPLLESLLLPARKRLAQDQLLLTQYRVSHEVLALVAEVRGAAYAVLAEQELKVRLAMIVRVNEAAADLARRQYEAGNIPQLELAEIQASAQETQVELARTQAKMGVAREQLNRLLGLTSAQIGWKISGGLPALPASEALPENFEEMALEQRLDLSALRLLVALAEKNWSLKSHTRLLPGEADLGVSTERESDGERLTGPHLEMQLPLFDQGQPELARLAAEMRQARDRVAALTADIGSEVRSARDSLIAARQAAEYYQQTLLPQRRLILHETLLQYNAMQKSVAALLAAKHQQQITERESVEALHDYWVACVAFERALGHRLSTETISHPAVSPTDS